MSKISHKHTYCVCLCKSANDISLGEDMPNSSNERTIMNCAKGVSLIMVKNGCDSLIYVAKLKEIKDSNTDCRYTLIHNKSMTIDITCKSLNQLHLHAKRHSGSINGIYHFLVCKYKVLSWLGKST